MLESVRTSVTWTCNGWVQGLQDAAETEFVAKPNSPQIDLSPCETQGQRHTPLESEIYLPTLQILFSEGKISSIERQKGLMGAAGAGAIEPYSSSIVVSRCHRAGRERSPSLQETEG